MTPAAGGQGPADECHPERQVSNVFIRSVHAAFEYAGKRLGGGKKSDKQQ
jgi:hypothetical protein